MQTSPVAYVGVDIAKDTFDACLMRPVGKPQRKQFDNTPGGFGKLVRWAEHLASDIPCHYCMEATGPYWRALAEALAEADKQVSVVNPFLVRHAALGSGQINKTDSADALAIADYCRKEQPALWRICAPEIRQLVAYLRRLESLKCQRTAELNRQQEPGQDKEVLGSIKRMLGVVDAEIARVEALIRKHIDNHPRLKEDAELLESIPGIAGLTAAWLIAELGDVSSYVNAKSAAAYVGLAPAIYQSGTSVKRPTRINKRGRQYLRKALYMPALAAIRFNPIVRTFYERLVSGGMARKAGVAAVMRKLVMISYGILKSRHKFTEQPAQPAA